jgi:hypothetical protein
MAKKKAAPEKNARPPRTPAITQHQRDRVAAILAIMLGLVSVSEGGRVLLGITVPEYQVLPWLVWYNVGMAVVSVIAGAGLLLRQHWSLTLAVNILACHAVVFAGLFALYSSGQAVAWKSIFAMMFRTFTWLVIYLLVRWKRQDGR